MSIPAKPVSPASRTTLHATSPLFRQLADFSFLYIATSPVHFVRAEECFSSLVKAPLEADVSSEVLRYFRLAQCMGAEEVRIAFYQRYRMAQRSERTVSTATASTGIMALEQRCSWRTSVARGVRADAAASQRDDFRTCLVLRRAKLRNQKFFRRTRKRRFTPLLHRSFTVGFTSAVKPT